MTDNSARKNDETKLRYDLIPADAFEQLAQVFTLGANKYTTTSCLPGGEALRLVVGVCTCEQPTVIPIDPTSPRGSVEAAIRQILCGEVQPIRKASSRFSARADGPTGRSSAVHQSATRSTDGDSRRDNDDERSRSMDSTSARTRSSVISAERGSRTPTRLTSTSITITKRGWHEVFSATDVTRLSVFFATIQAYLDGHAPTCRTRRYSAQEGPEDGQINLTKTGARNWESGFHYTRIYAAMMRHLQAWYQGEDYASDDGQHHLAAVAWGAFVLMHFQLSGPVMDDRPTGLTPR